MDIETRSADENAARIMADMEEETSVTAGSLNTEAFHQRVERQRAAATAKHCIITDECRQNRGDIGAAVEAIERVQDELKILLQNWPVGNGTTFHLKLEVERAQQEPTP